MVVQWKGTFFLKVNGAFGAGDVARICGVFLVWRSVHSRQGCGAFPPASSFKANPIIPQSQKNMAKGTRYSSGTKLGITAPAVPRARKKADNARTIA